jgi:hypothetical protein
MRYRNAGIHATFLEVVRAGIINRRLVAKASLHVDGVFGQLEWIAFQVVGMESVVKDEVGDRTVSIIRMVRMRLAVDDGIR